tara:strand:- start:351 stop:689 length:339 start_codon:yes stop_codon:yes gene_type:complete
MKTLLKILFTAIISFTALASCEKKKESQPDCERYKTGTITISNSSSNPYNIYVDDIFEMQISGNSISTKITIDEGNNRKLYAEQMSGYLLYPTKRTEYFNVVRCSDYGWQIP